MRRDWAHPSHIYAGTGLTPATSAPGLAHPSHICAPCHICTGTGALGVRYCFPEPTLPKVVRVAVESDGTVGYVAVRMDEFDLAKEWQVQQEGILGSTLEGQEGYFTRHTRHSTEAAESL